MNATLCRTTDVELELSDLVSLDEVYATAPMVAITPLPQLPDEEELHSQFEAALRERTTAFDSCFNRLRDSSWYTEVSAISLLSSPLATPKTESLAEMAIAETSSVHTDQVYATQMQTIKQMSHGLWNRSVQRAFIFCCFALSCMLLGFDVMGLLILHAH
jgi:hypothetical protein